jgi:hypothetical protein
MVNGEDPGKARRSIIDQMRGAAKRPITPDDTAAKMRQRHGSNQPDDQSLSPNDQSSMSGPDNFKGGPGGALPEHARGTFDAAGERFLQGMEGMEKTAEALAEFGNTVDKIMTALLDISDLVEYDGNEIKPSVQKFLVEVAQADPKDREALKERARSRIETFIKVVNDAEPIHTKRTQELLETLRSLSRSLS